MPTAPSLVFIHNRGTGMFRLPVRGSTPPRFVILRPGLSAHDLASLESVGFGGKCDPFDTYASALAIVDPCKMHAPDAVELAKVTADKGALAAWLRDEKREPVKVAAQAQLAKLTK